MRITEESEEAVLSLERIEQAAAFTGFAPEDFALFELRDFAARMPRLKQQLTPKLRRIGAALAERMSAALEEPLNPHVAQHLRRTVNPPEETWVAFARGARAYKPFAHLRVAISAEQVRVLVFVEDYAEEKAAFAANLERNAESLAAWLLHHPTIHAYDMPEPGGAFRRGSTLDAAALQAFAQRMRRVKGQHARFGIPFDRSHPILQNGPEFLDAVLEAARILKPLYDCGKPEFVYTYTPEVIEGI